jgi:subtilisin family serine protease
MSENYLGLSDILQEILGDDGQKIAGQLKSAFDRLYQAGKLEKLGQDSGDGLAPPEIHIVPSAELHGGKSAYSPEMNSLYLAQDYLTELFEQFDKPGQVAKAIVKELKSAIAETPTDLSAAGEGVVSSPNVDNTAATDETGVSVSSSVGHESVTDPSNPVISDPVSMGTTFVDEPNSQPSSPTSKLNLSTLTEGVDYAAGEVIIKFKSGMDMKSAEFSAQMSALQQEMGAYVLESTQKLGIQLLKLNGMSAAEAIAKYSNNPLIEYIEPNYTLHVDAIPNDPSFNQLWGLHNTGQAGGTPDADIDAPEAWDITQGNGVVVGVIDTGVDYNHPDLVNNMWVNSGETAGDGIDNDGNGFIDDVYGYDFANNDGNPFDDNNHGTHVAGTIAAQGNNNVGVIGVAPDAQIMALKFLGASGSGSLFNAIQAIEYATMMGADLTNNSWGGGGFSQALKDAIAAGPLFVAAAGNSGLNTDLTPSYPASYDLDNIISVAASDRNDQIAGFSNYGATSVDLGAPGVSVYSTISGGGYASFSGTSMASPHVAGVAALLMSQDSTLTAQQVKDRILDYADPIASLQGKTLTGARLNAYNSLTQTAPSPGEIEGTIWNDLDGDGTQDIDEATLSDWTVYLDQNQNGTLDAGETSTVTDVNGDYSFTNVAPGTYTVAQVMQPDWMQTSPTAVDYNWSDSNQAGGPDFNWVDISGIGTAVTLFDDTSVDVALPFNFSFFGQDKTSVKIASNGYLTFGTNGTDYTNDPVPNSAAPNDVIAPFWDDLNPGAGGSVYYHYNATEEQFIVQYQNVQRFGTGGSLTFQTILDSDGSILFQYDNLIGTLNSATVGLENSNGSDGVQVAYNQNYLSNDLAISFNPFTTPQPHTIFVGSGAIVSDLNFGNQQVIPPNWSFETGDFTDWETIGETSIKTDAFGIDPTDGTYHALLTTGDDSARDSQIETFLGVSAGTLDGMGNGNATEGSALKLSSLQVQAGDILTFDWNFLTKEDTPSSFSDFGFVTLSSEGTSELADTSSTFIPFGSSFNEQTDYGTFTYLFTADATIDLGVGVVDVGDTSVKSGLLVDNLQVTQLNGSFETGDFNHWDTVGNTSIQTASFGSNPTDGNYQALITNGAGSVTDTALETSLGLSAGTLDGMGNGNATQGSAIQLMPLNVKAGDVLTFDWNFLTNEGTPSFYNDFGFVSVASDGTSELADTYGSFVLSPTSFNEETGYGTFSYEFADAGSYIISLGVVDVGDTSVDSGLLVDNFSIVSGSSMSSVLDFTSNSVMAI